MKLPRLHLGYFWSAESGLTGLLIFILAYLFVVCALGDFGFGDMLADTFFSFVIVTGVIATFRQHWLGILATILAVAGLVLTWQQEIHPLQSLALIDAIIRLLFLAFLLAVLIVQVFGAGPVTAHRIRGAIIVYLLLGGLWALLYQIAALTIPHAFHLPAGLADSTALPQRVLTYFSFVTLTTTGFGDITPTHSLTRTLAMFEALAGQLYLVITLARLVSLAVMEQNTKNPQ
jgi:hypothetical protein